MAEQEAEATGKPVRHFADFEWTTKNRWRRNRRVVGKAEWMPGRGESGANPRFVVTSLEASAYTASRSTSSYCARGKMENRIKECQLDLFADPWFPTQPATWDGCTSTKTMRANRWPGGHRSDPWKERGQQAVQEQKVVSSV